jgi:hypothetical protein
MTTVRLEFDGDPVSETDMVKIALGAPGPAGPPGPPGGTAASPAMRVAHEILHRANFTMGNNKFTAGDSTSGGTVVPEGTIPAGFTLEYPASVAERPRRYYGGIPEMDGFGVRLYTSTWQPGVRIASGSPSCVVALYGDELLMELDAGHVYKFLVRENGVDRYLPNSAVTLDAGSGAQWYRLAFPTTAQRIVTIETSTDTLAGETQEPGRIGALRVKSSNSVLYAPPREGPRIEYISDSGMQGPNGYAGASNACVISACLGIKDSIVSCNMATGVLVTNESALKWPERTSDWTEPAPDILVFRLSWAEPGSVTTAAAITAYMDVINGARVDLPDTFIIVQGYDYGPAADYPNEADAITINDGVAAAISALEDPFLKMVLPFDSVDESVFTGYPGTADALLAGHYSAEGDLVLGFLLAERYLSLFRQAYYGVDIVETPPVDLPASISPATLNVTLNVNTPADLLLGTISGGVASGTPTGIAPVGCEFVRVGQQLRLTGTPTTEDADIAVAIGVTTDDGDVTFNLTGKVDPEIVIEDDPFLAQTLIVLNGGGITNDIVGGPAVSVGTGTPTAAGGYVVLETGDSLTFPDSSGMGLGTAYAGSWTIDGRTKCPALGASHAIVSNVDGNAGTFEVQFSATGQINFWEMNSAYDYMHPTEFVPGQAIEWAICYDSVLDELYFYVGTACVFTLPNPTPILSFNTAPFIGRRPNFGDTWLESETLFRFASAARYAGLARALPMWPVQVT